ncbi:metal-dependent protein hydrolase [Artemisia annua]|uniref:Metal-dependent protein hydrolase n=1 Tax=Artemisia annua TaxID=35608 RepID=A0A2U1L8T7_ARTAN|nr:metal-dependent protein hydrolase [Artemisia annua]
MNGPIRGPQMLFVHDGPFSVRKTVAVTVLHRNTDVITPLSCFPVALLMMFAPKSFEFQSVDPFLTDAFESANVDAFLTDYAVFRTSLEVNELERTKNTKVQFVGGQQQILGRKGDIGPCTEMVVQMVATLCALQTQLLGYSSSCGVANLNEFIHPRNDKWRVQAVAVSPDDHLSLIAGIYGCVFVHSSGFICGNKTYDGH